MRHSAINILCFCGTGQRPAMKLEANPIGVAAMLRFQEANSDVTLSEGLREYYDSQAGLVTGRGVSDSAREFFRCHDAAHVVFGCSTTLTNEAIVKIWSFLGTTGGFSLLRDYRSPESKEIYEQIKWSDIPRTALRSVVNVPRVSIRCRRMHKRWPWHDFDAYLDVGLADIRNEFGIEVVTVP